MARPVLGTREWFIGARLDLLESTRAIQSIYMAAEALGALTKRWDGLDAALRASLLTSGVVNYSRPFVDRHTDLGVRRYKLKRIAGEPGFDVGLHRHILQLRHKMVAHSDEDFLDARIHAQTVLIARDEKSVRLVAEVGARSTALWQLKEKHTAERWAGHMTAALKGAGRDASGVLETYFQAARDYPDDCPLLDLDGSEEKLAHFRATVGAGETFSVPIPEMPLSHLKPPPLSEDGDAYLFQLFSLTTRGSGTTVTDVADGWSIATRSANAPPLEDVSG